MRDDSTVVMAGGRMRVDPAVIAHAAGRMLELWRVLWEIARPAISNLDTDGRAFGSLRGAGQLWRAQAESLTEVQIAIERLGQVLEGDVDRLYRIAFAVKAADESAAGRMHRVGRV